MTWIQRMAPVAVAFVVMIGTSLYSNTRQDPQLWMMILLLAQILGEVQYLNSQLNRPPDTTPKS